MADDIFMGTFPSNFVSRGCSADRIALRRL
jgi:hypothetical protein